jgi:hypothetical protein
MRLGDRRGMWKEWWESWAPSGGGPWLTGLEGQNVELVGQKTGSGGKEGLYSWPRASLPSQDKDAGSS